MPIKIISNRSLTANVAEITTTSSHNLSSGDYITIDGINATFDGNFTVLDVPSSSVFTYAKIANNVISIPSSGSVIYADIDPSPRPAYMYDKQTDSWHQISGAVDTNRNYVWTGYHLYEAPASFEDVLNTKNIIANGTASVNGSAQFNGNLRINGGINVFASTAARDAAMPTPVTGTIAYVTSAPQRLYIWDGAQWDIVVTSNPA